MDSDFSASPDGSKIAFTSESRHVQAWMFPFDAQRGRVIGHGSAVTSPGMEAWDTAISRDGRRLAFSAEAIGPMGTMGEVATGRAERLPLRRTISTPEVDQQWSLDGSRLGYFRMNTSSGVLGEKRRLPAEAAALVNGTYAHSLDFDDTHLPSIVHPSAPLVPAVLAQAEAVGASPEQTAVALVAGYEVLCRLAMAQYEPALGNSVMFEHGFHATSIVGAVAGAAACARLLELDPEGIADAIAVACSVGSGLIEANRGRG